MPDGNGKGIIQIADISGYTAFLNQSDLEHAQDTLQSLLEVLIENTHLPLVISRLEGYAVISYDKEIEKSIPDNVWPPGLHREGHRLSNFIFMTNVIL